MTTSVQKHINILFDQYSYEIYKIYDQNTSVELKPNKLPSINNNIYNWAKSIKPSPDQFGDLSTFLMAIKKHLPNGVKYKFSNNCNFLSEYLLDSNYKSNKISRFFETYYTITSNYHSIIVLFNMKPEIPILCTNQLIKHELINPLHAIKLSGDQIRNHIRQHNKSDISIDDIDKYNNIILNAVDNSIHIIDILTYENLTTKDNLFSIEKITLNSFKSHIQHQLELINKTYFMFTPVLIQWQPEILESNYISTHYVCVNPNYMKIILDNVFKNIYGHINVNNILHQFNKSEINEFNLVSKKSNSKFIISISGNEIKLVISNKITLTNTINNNFCGDTTASKSFKSIIDKYNLAVDSPYELSNGVPDLASIKSKPNNNMGIGITLINNLCDKMGFKWNLIDNTTEICFIITIPVIGETRHLGNFYQPIFRHKKLTAQCVL